MNRNKHPSEAVVEMRKKGKTFQEIGNHLGITRQRAFQICKSHQKQIRDKEVKLNPRYQERRNPHYPEEYCGTFCICEKCGESYEPICVLEHICKKQNSYPRED